MSRLGFVLILCLAAAPCLADRVVLKNGSEFHGIVVEEKRSDVPEPGTLVSITVELEQGGRVGVRGEDVAAIDRSDVPLWQEYRNRSGEAGGDVDAHWAVAEWCKAHGLPHERVEELRAIEQLAGSDYRVNCAFEDLGYHKVREGDGWKWVSPDEYWQGQGYVRFEGNWVLPSERDRTLQGREQARAKVAQVAEQRRREEVTRAERRPRRVRSEVLQVGIGVDQGFQWVYPPASRGGTWLVGVR